MQVEREAYTGAAEIAILATSDCIHDDVQGMSVVSLCLQGQLVAGFKYAAHGVDTKEVCFCRLHLGFVLHTAMCTIAAPLHTLCCLGCCALC